METLVGFSQRPPCASLPAVSVLLLKCRAVLPSCWRPSWRLVSPYSSEAQKPASKHCVQLLSPWASPGARVLCSCRLGRLLLHHHLQLHNHKRGHSKQSFFFSPSRTHALGGAVLLTAACICLAGCRRGRLRSRAPGGWVEDTCTHQLAAGMYCAFGGPVAFVWRCNCSSPLSRAALLVPAMKPKPTLHVPCRQTQALNPVFPLPHFLAAG